MNYADVTSNSNLRTERKRIKDRTTKNYFLEIIGKKCKFR